MRRRSGTSEKTPPKGYLSLQNNSSRKKTWVLEIFSLEIFDFQLLASY